MTGKLGATRWIYRDELKWLWPATDTECAAVVFDSKPDLERAMSFCKKRRTAIQAGGNCGVWASYLAKEFQQVWTWEPDPLNYKCLATNTMHHKNVFPVNAGLGSKNETVGLDRIAGNCGAHQIATGRSNDAVPIEMLDSYGKEQLGDVDLLYLDVEGYELHALVGGSSLIHRCKPVIAVEDKGLSERYGVAQGDVVRYIVETHNYEVCDRYARDIVLRPRSA